MVIGCLDCVFKFESSVSMCFLGIFEVRLVIFVILVVRVLVLLKEKFFIFVKVLSVVLFLNNMLFCVVVVSVDSMVVGIEIIMV